MQWLGNGGKIVRLDQKIAKLAHLQLPWPFLGSGATSGTKGRRGKNARRPGGEVPRV
jgi:hypothetical protein